MNPHRPGANRLRNSTSPYLQQHAGNPVDWHPWDPEALSLAREQNKPILLSIGYSACHWCHVMAHESFEHPDTAALMNRLFVNIKVDREERPDLDRIYQTAHQLLAQRPGGWPLTMFLSPDDLTPFFGGTYFPREARHGLPAFPDLLQSLEQAYRGHRKDIHKQNVSLRQALNSLNPSNGDGGVVLDVIGLNKQDLPGEVAEPVLAGLMIAMLIVVIPALMISLWFARKVNISRDEVETIQAALRERQATG